MHILIRIKSMDVYANKTEKVKQEHFFFFFLKLKLYWFRKRAYKQAICVQGDRNPSKRKLSRKQRESYAEKVLLILIPLLPLCLQASHLLLSDRSDWLVQSLWLGWSCLRTGHSHTLLIPNFCLDRLFRFSVHRDTLFCPSRLFRFSTCRVYNPFFIFNP